MNIDTSVRLTELRLCIYRGRIFKARVNGRTWRVDPYKREYKWLTFDQKGDGVRLGGRWFRKVTPIIAPGEMYENVFTVYGCVAEQIEHYLDSVHALKGGARP